MCINGSLYTHNKRVNQGRVFHRRAKSSNPSARRYLKGISYLPTYVMLFASATAFYLRKPRFPRRHPLFQPIGRPQSLTQ